MITRHLIDNKDKIITGLRTAADVVASTMGAGGNTVTIFDNNGDLRFTKDGVTVAKSIALEDEIENIGAQLLINSANKTVEEVGDGTTTTSVLLKAMVDNNVSTTDLQKALPEVIERIKAQSKALTTTDEVKAIATIASNSEELGSLISEIYEQVGLDAFVNLHYGESAKTEYEVKRGFEFNSGFISARFGNQPNGDCIFDDAMIVIDENRSSDYEVYVEAMNVAAKRAKPIIVISPEFSAQIKRLVMENQQRGVPICLVKSPGFGKQVKENYKDIAAILSESGTVDRIVVTPTSFTIYNENSPNLESRIKDIKDSLKASFIEDHDEFFINNRLHKLKGTTAIVYAGGITEKNMKEEYDRLEDAIGAVKAAIRSGYVRGGGYSLLKATKDTDIEVIGSSPYRQILTNADIVIPDSYTEGEEVNVRTNNKEDFLTTGIIDPTEVVVQALVNSSASYKLLQETKYIIYNEQSQKNQLFGG